MTTSGDVIATKFRCKKCRCENYYYFAYTNTIEHTNEMKLIGNSDHESYNFIQ